MELQERAVADDEEAAEIGTTRAKHIMAGNVASGAGGPVQLVGGAKPPDEEEVCFSFHQFIVYIIMLRTYYCYDNKS